MKSKAPFKLTNLLFLVLTLFLVNCTSNNEELENLDSNANVKIEFLIDDINLTAISKNSINTLVRVSNTTKTTKEIGLEYSLNENFSDLKSEKETITDKSKSTFVVIKGLREGTKYYVKAYVKFDDDSLIKSKSKYVYTTKGVI